MCHSSHCDWNVHFVEHWLTLGASSGETVIAQKVQSRRHTASPSSNRRNA